MSRAVEWPAFLVQSGDYTQDTINRAQQGPEAVAALASTFVGRVVSFVNDNLAHPSSEPTSISLVHWTHGEMEAGRFGIGCLAFGNLNVDGNVLTPATERALRHLGIVYGFDVNPPSRLDQAGDQLLPTDIEGMMLLRQRQLTGNGLGRGGGMELNSLAYSLVFPV